MSSNESLYSSLHCYPRIYVKDSLHYWAETRHCKVEHLKGIKEKFCEVNEQLDPEIISLFGSSRPGAEQYLLHLAPGWNSNKHKTPLILIHGAGLDASSFTNLYGMGYKGLQEQLTSLGYRVFALSFSHSHGDNFYQAEQLADAILRVKELCQAEQADIVAHSKGGIAARIYLSNLGITSYRHDVRQYIMLGTPNLGTDFAFRNPGLSYMIYLSGGNGVIAWDKLKSPFFTDISLRSIYSDGAFPGQNQILYPWDQQYSLDMSQPDWWTTYYGGCGYLSHSRGIKQAVSDGKKLIEKLENKGLEPGIEFAVMAGDNHLFGLIPGESSGPSDGIVFIDSVLNTGALSSRGAILKEKTVLHLNHMELLYKKAVSHWIDRQLNP